MEGNTTFAKLTRVADQKHVRPPILAQLYSATFAIINHTGSLTYLIVVAEIVSTLQKIALISLNDIAMLSHIEIFKVMHDALSYTNPDLLLRVKDPITGLTLACIALLLCALGIGSLLFSKHTRPDVARKVYRTAALFFCVGLPILNTPMYLIFASQLNCWNPGYHSECWTPVHLTAFAVSAVGVLLLVIMGAVSILFIYVDNFVMALPLNGSAKLLIAISELEKAFLSIIYIVDTQKVFQTQVLVVLAALFAVKAYMEFNNHAFYERPVARTVLFLEAFYTGRLLISLIVRFSSKTVENWTFGVIFFTAIALGSATYMFFIEHQKFEEFPMVNSVKDEASLTDLIGRLIILFRLQANDHKMRQKLVNFFAVHVNTCDRQAACSCGKVLKLLIDNKIHEHEKFRTAFFTFLTEVIIEFQRTFPKTINLHLIKMFIEFVELGRITPVAFQMKFIQSQKFGWNGLFSIFMLE
jgi:hypothetical protein